MITDECEATGDITLRMGSAEHISEHVDRISVVKDEEKRYTNCGKANYGYTCYAAAAERDGQAVFQRLSGRVCGPDIGPDGHIHALQPLLVSRE